MRILGLDLGTKTLGVSITDKMGIIVSPLKVIRFPFEDYNKALEEVQKIVLEYNVSLVVLGLPKNMDGSIGFAGERSLNFQKMLESLNLKVELVDERLTTKEAENLVHERGDNIKSSKERIDSVAACVILESYLRSKNDFRK